MKKRLFALVLMSMCAGLTSAATETLQTTGTVSSTCSFSGKSAGSFNMRAGTNYVLSSTIGDSGTPASITVNYVGSPTLTVSDVLGFDAGSPTLPTSANFVNSAVLSSAGVMSLIGGVYSKTFASGSSDTLNYSTVASLPSTSAFPTGSYATTVTMTCI